MKDKKNKEYIFSKVKEAIAEITGIKSERINLDSNLINDIGIDSFSATELTFLLKGIFKMDISQGNFTNVATVGDIVKYFESKIKKK